MQGSVRKRGDKWSYYFNIGKDENGKYKKKEKGGFATKKDAETALRKAISDFEIDGHVTKANAYTLGEYIKYYFDNVAHDKLKFTTYNSYQNINKNHIIPEIGHIPLSKVTGIILQDYFTKKSKCNQSTLGQVRNILNNTFNLAIKQKLLNSNPMKNIDINKKKTKSDLPIIYI